MLRCLVCRTRRVSFASMVDHERASGHKGPCLCGGYHYHHRPGSPTCWTNPYNRTAAARREGVSGDDLLDAFIDDALFNVHKPSKDNKCPF